MAVASPTLEICCRFCAMRVSVSLVPPVAATASPSALMVARASSALIPVEIRYWFACTRPVTSKGVRAASALMASSAALAASALPSRLVRPIWYVSIWALNWTPVEVIELTTFAVASAAEVASFARTLPAATVMAFS